eukprot:Phypoly_transcript_14133.p1 GENE.Phypoly_transcript_14133~~Phypoly_transcript_14133.p1  ORF type:complete len:313 (+),score=50.75 Phypoly_transcript_14133:48-941(+)
MDWKIQKYGFWLEEKDFPLVFGVDVAGKIAAVGSDVKQFKVGDRVAAILSYPINRKLQYGAFQEYSVASEQAVTRIPDSISYVQAATLPLGLTSAVVSYDRDMKMERPNATKKGKLDDIVLVWGASSSVGLYFVQLAAQSGYTVIATSSKHNFDLVKEAGAHTVVDHSDPDVVAQIRQAAGKGIKYAYDSIGTDESQKNCIELVDPRGVFGTVLIQPQGDFPKTLTVKGLYAAAFYDPSEKELADYYFKHLLPTALENGVIKPNKVEIVPGWIAGTQNMLDQHSKGVSGKKLVIARA